MGEGQEKTVFASLVLTLSLSLSLAFNYRTPSFRTFSERTKKKEKKIRLKSAP